MLNKWILINIRRGGRWLSKIRSVRGLGDEGLRSCIWRKVFAVTIRLFANGINGKILIIGKILIVGIQNRLIAVSESIGVLNGLILGKRIWRRLVR